MGWLIALAVVLVIALMPVGVYGLYNSQGAVIKLAIGPAHYQLYPSGKKTDKKNKGKQSKEHFSSTQKATGKSGGSVSDFLPFIRTVLELLSELRRKIRANRLELKIILGGNDPCDLGIKYGRAWAILGSLIPVLERVFNIRKRELEVECDFNALDTTIFARIEIAISFAGLLYLATRYGLRVLKQYIDFSNKRKGGATT